MASLEEQDFSVAATGSANASLTYPTQASALRKGSFILLKGHPCKISSITTSKPGKHGHAKVSIEAYDIFTHKKYEEISPAHANMDVPIVVRQEYLLLHIDGGYLSLFDNESGETKNDVQLPETEIGEKIEAMFGKGKSSKDVFVVILGAMGMEMAVECKEVEGA